MWDDEKASRRQKKIMDVLELEDEIYSNELKIRAGFGKGKERHVPRGKQLIQSCERIHVFTFLKKLPGRGFVFARPMGLLLISFLL